MSLKFGWSGHAAALLFLALTVPVQAGGESRREEYLPCRADELMPLKKSSGVYIVKEGPEAEKGQEVPFTLEPRGDRWVLTKQGLTWHELKRDSKGNIVILRETDILENRQVEYDPPVVLLPHVVQDHTAVSGKTRVTVRNPQTGTVTHRGECEWRLTFAGIESLSTPSGVFQIYHFQAVNEVNLPLAYALLRVDFGYAIGRGMVVTAAEQVTRALGLFSSRVFWRLEQLS